MSAPDADPAGELVAQAAVVVGGSSAIGLETHPANPRASEVILRRRDPGRLRRAAEEVGAHDVAAFDATDVDRAQQLLSG